jgi:chemotaxis response regulator CheB
MHAECAMEKIRVLVANRPRLMRELLLATISDQPDIEIVGEAQADQEILPLIDRTHPDFLIIALETTGQRPSLCDFVLEKFPQVRILALAPEQNASVFYWASLDIHSAPVEASERGVLSALRHSPLSVGGVQ